MNVLLIHPFTQKRTFCPPLGILYIAGSLRARGYDVRVIDMDVEPIDDARLTDMAQQLDPLFIGITCNIVQVSEVSRLARLLSPLGAPVVVGGPMPSAAPEKLLECDGIDYVVIGEGEHTITELADALREGDDISQIAGLAHRKDGEIHRTAPREFITDLDSLPFPAHDLNGGIAKYAVNPTPAPETPFAAVLPSRGCPFNCNFCSNPWKTTNRKRSVQNVIDELIWITEEFGVKQVFFYDDSFNSNPEYVRELCQAILDNNLKFGWRADCRANERLVDLETLKLMKASGCWLLAFGVETGNPKVMKSLRKGLKLEEVVRTRELCREAGVLFRSYFMIGALGETYKTVFDTIDFARQLDPDDPQFSIFSPILGTEAYQKAKEGGWIIDENWNHLDLFHATVSTEKLSNRDTEMLQVLARINLPQWWGDVLAGREQVIPEAKIRDEMRRRFGKEGEMATEMWNTYQRNEKGEHPLVLLNPPSPPGITSGKDTMGGFGQTFKGDLGNVVPPVDMAYLAANKRAEGVPVHVIDAVGSRLDSDHTLRLIESLEPSGVLMRTSVPTLKFDEEFAEQIKERTGITPEMFGPAVGETILDEDLDSLPMPAWELLPEYNLGSLSRNQRYLPIQASVGCPYDCDYCPYPAAQGTKFRGRSPENVVLEMLHFKETLGVQFFLFRDPVFTLNRKATLELCDLLIENRADVQWRCETRADLLTDEMLEQMAQAGCVGINFAVESVSEDPLALVHRKQIPQEKLESVVRKCKQLGIEAFVFYIVGLPGETRDSFLKTLGFAKWLDTPFVQFTPIIAYPHTKLDEWAREQGYLSGELHDAPHFGTKPLMRNEHLSASEIEQLCEIAYRQLGMRNETVALAHCPDYAKVEKAVQHALHELGGIEAFVGPGQRVLIKPNLIGSYSPDQAATTHPEVVRAIIRQVKQAGATPVVGDSPGGAEISSYKHMRQLYEITGMAEVCESEGVEIVDFSQAGTENIQIFGKRLRELTISKAVTEADVVINVPKAKTHAFTYFTGAIKNLYGVVPGLRKAEYHKQAPSAHEFAELINDIHEAMQDKVRLVIMDAVVGMDGNGPTAGVPRRGNFVLAGSNSLIVDLTACRLLGLDHAQSLPLAEAIQRYQQLGELRISVVGDSIQSVRPQKFQPPLFQSQESFVETYGSVYPQIDQEKCAECGRCVRACPVGAIKDFVVDENDCIKCLCCFETCQNDAVQLVKRTAEEGDRETRERGDKGMMREVATFKRSTLNVQHSELRPDAPMKVLVISNLFPPHFIGGYELACKEIADRLSQRGHQVMVLTSMFGFDEPLSDAAEAAMWQQDGYPVIRKLDHCYGRPGQVYAGDIPQSAYNEYLIRKYAQEFQPDCVYLWNFHGMGMVSIMRVIDQLGVPCVFHAMDYHLIPGHGLEKRQEQAVRQFLSRPQCRVIAMSETVRRKFLGQGYQNVDLIYHGIEVTPGPREHEQMRKLLYTGQIQQGKGIHVLLSALQKMIGECPDLALDIFGGGDERYHSQLKEIARQADLPVTFHGSVPRKELLSKYAEFDAFVLPTLREEPFGIVMIEAMNAGLAVIGSNAGGPDEVITHGETGMLFATGNADELAQAILTLYRDPELYQQIARNGYRLVQERFDIERSVAQVEVVLRGEQVAGQPVASRESEKSRLDVRALPRSRVETSEPVNAQTRKHANTPLVWAAPVYDPSGYADEARNFVQALDRYTDIPLRLISLNWSHIQADLDAETRQVLERLSSGDRPKHAIEVYHFMPAHYFTNLDALYSIGRTMFETDRIPKQWVARCNERDEIWVPTEFNIETFANAGVDPKKLVKIPGVIDTRPYEQPAEPLPLDIERDYTFLTVYDWSWRKGWDVLLRAYFAEFGPDEGTLLLLKTYCASDQSGEFTRQIRAKIEHFIRRQLKLDPARCAPYTVCTDILSSEEMPRLYRTADAYVSPTRGEGWGRPLMEAMACGLPTIATRWSGHTEFMNDQNSYLFDYQIVPVPEFTKQELPLYQGHRWAEPSLEHLRETMRHVFEHREAASERGARAREDVLSQYNWEVTAGRLTERLAEIIEAPGFGKETGRQGDKEQPSNVQRSNPRPATRQHANAQTSNHLRLIWEGPQLTHSSLARVNRELVLALTGTGKCDLSLIPKGGGELSTADDPRFETLESLFNKPLSGDADVHVRHEWPPNFERPAHGKWVIIQPWEYGSMPAEWLPHFRDEVDEIWVYSQYNRDCYINDGVPANKVFVFPHGVDFRTFQPQQSTWPRLREFTQKGTIFLFVGGSIWRKGIDVLLDAYSQAFTRRDDVALIIKDMGNDSFYKGQTAEKQIHEIQSKADSPEIVHLTEMLSDTEIAQLYRSCTALVHPYRGEGFGLPVAEAMACGCPVVISQGGACDDFTPHDVAYWIDTDRAWLKMEQKTAKRAWVLQPNVDSLVVQLRRVAKHPEEAAQRGELAALYASETLRWEHTARAILEHLGAGEQPDYRPVSAAVWANERGKAFAGEEQWDAARREFERAARIAPRWGEPWNNLAVIAWNHQEYEQAIESLRLGLSQDPENLDLTINYALMSEQAGEKQQAHEILQRYLEAHPDADEIKRVLQELLVA